MDGGEQVQQIEKEAVKKLWGVRLLFCIAYLILQAVKQV